MNADPAEEPPFTFDDVSVVMATYNEEAAVGTVLSDVDRVTDGRAEVVCVDWSSDRTPEIAREHGATVIEREPRGYGVAFALLSSVLVGQRVHDTTTGMRAYRREVIEGIEWTENTGLSAELLLRPLMGDIGCASYPSTTASGRARQSSIPSRAVRRSRSRSSRSP